MSSVVHIVLGLDFDILSTSLCDTEVSTKAGQVDPRRIDLLLERIRTFELFARPEFNRRQPERQSFSR